MAYLDLDIGLSSLAHQLSVVGAVLFLVGRLPLRYALSVSSLKFVRYSVRCGAAAVRYAAMRSTN